MIEEDVPNETPDTGIILDFSKMTTVNREELEKVIREAPEFPVNYDDHVLAIEQGFKPRYVEFIKRLKSLV